MPYAEVAVNAPLPHRRAFSYSLPEGMHLHVGQAVYVPFGRRTLQGIVLELPEIPSYSETRDILAPLSDGPILSPARVALGRWISEEYLAPLFQSLALMLPPGFEQKPLTYVSPLVTAQQAAGIELSPRQREVLSVLLAEGRREMEELRKRAQTRALTSVLGQLEREGLVERTYGLAPPRVRAKVLPYYRLLVPPEEALARAETMPGSRPSRRAELLNRLAEVGSLPLDVAVRTAGGEPGLRALERARLLRLDEKAGVVNLSVSAERARAEAVGLRRTAVERAQAAALRLLAAEAASLPASQVRARTGLTAAAATGLAEQGLITIEKVSVERDPLAGHHYPHRPPPVLTPEQEGVYRVIVEALEASAGGERPSTGSGWPSTGSGRGGTAFLLHGVTGSGKTEVYLKALEKTVAMGRRGIVLVPEIALTPQTIERFAARFPHRVAVFHSGLTLGEQYDEWRRIRDGEFDVVIGSRSAVPHSSHSTAKTEAIRASQAGHRLSIAALHVGQAPGSSASPPSK